MLKKNQTLILLVPFFILLGCNSKGSQNESELKSKIDSLKHKQEVEEQFLKIFKDFQSRPKYTVLTEQIIDTTSNDKLLLVVYDFISSKLPIDNTKEYNTILNWKKPKQAIYILFLFNSEMSIGSFNHYYSLYGEFCKLLPNTLKLVNANEFSDLTKRANKVYEIEYLSKNKKEPMDDFSKSNKIYNPLKVYNDEYDKLNKKESLDKILIKYIREHKSYFIDK